MRAQAIYHNGKGRGSRFIKWFTRGRFSHESVRFLGVPDELAEWAQDEYGAAWDKSGHYGEITHDHEFESIQGPGVRHQPFVPSDNQCWKDFEHTEEQAVEMFKEACRLVGDKYDWRGIGGFMTRRNVQHPSKWFCSEYGCHLRRHVNILTQNAPDHTINPHWSAASVIYTEAKREGA